MCNKNILVINDCLKNYDDEHILQLLSKAHELALQKSCQVHLICFGKTIEENEVQRLYEYGADALYFFKSSLFNESDYRYFVDATSEFIDEYQPELILIPTSTNGKILSSILSNRYGAGLTADCIDIQLKDNKEFIFLRAAMGETVIAQIVCIHCSIKIGTVKPTVFQAKKRSYSHTPVIKTMSFQPEIKPPLYDVLDSRQAEEKSSIDLSKSSVVFCLGRGVKDETMVQRFFALADKLDVGIAVTRPLVEERFADKELQVGQSGKSISPKIYVGFGISGASQHIVGIKNAELIVAVNHDKNASIFEYSDVIIEEDLEVILTEMENRVAK